MKTGTTSLHHHLRAHPRVHIPAEKELNFFVEQHHWGRGVEWYEQQFRRAPEGALLGDVSPDYSKYPHYGGVPERMASVVPDVRLLYLVRDPIARMRSHYRHQVGAGREERPVDRALLEDRRYLDVSRYATQLDQYLEHFDREQMLVVLSEDLRSDEDTILQRVFAFLGLDAPAERAAGEWNRSDQIGRRRWLARLGARIPYARELMERLPPAARDRVMRLGFRPVAMPTSEPSPEVEARLRDELAGEVERLGREWLPQAPRRWGFTPAVTER